VKYTAENLVVRPAAVPGDPTLQLRITPASAGWDLISFEVRHLRQGETWSFASGDNELAVVNLTGRYGVKSDRGTWSGIGGRANVFAGGADALYLPRRTRFEVEAEQEGDFAVTWVPTDRDGQPWLIKAANVTKSIRGGDNVSRQINDLLPPGSPVHRMVLVEVYTPSGNWSSYPPHKHDRHVTDETGRILEADLEEVYYYQIDRPEGYAYQRVYTDETSPCHAAGNGFDLLVRADHGTAVLIPEGYHPVVSAPGYTTYYLNVLAGSAQSLANYEDPRFRWVKETYRGVDARVPLY
jgi:5-deoxy-glucuronate isomerase